tara:strand:- start:1177 stop:1395 length:219 start_codon:yes stop_codon:yes gene_type:complete
MISLPFEKGELVSVVWKEDPEFPGVYLRWYGSLFIYIQQHVTGAVELYSIKAQTLIAHRLDGFESLKNAKGI